MLPGCLPLAAAVFFLVLFPFFFTHLMITALGKLGLSPSAALLALIGILFGGTVNIPIRRIPRGEEYVIDPLHLFGFGRFFPRLRYRRTYTLLAVNLGGCIIPGALALYQAGRVVARGPDAALALVIATATSVVICYWLARPVPGVGIAMPALAPPVAAAVASLLLIPEFAPPVAFVAGVLGPLIGADLLHLADVKRIATGLASIGGAGTFDGIVLSGLLAAVLA